MRICHLEESGQLNSLWTETFTLTLLIGRRTSTSEVLLAELWIKAGQQTGERRTISGKEFGLLFLINDRLISSVLTRDGTSFRENSRGTRTSWSQDGPSWNEAERRQYLWVRAGFFPANAGFSQQVNRWMYCQDSIGKKNHSECPVIRGFRGSGPEIAVGGAGRRRQRRATGASREALAWGDKRISQGNPRGERHSLQSKGRLTEKGLGSQDLCGASTPWVSRPGSHRAWVWRLEGDRPMAWRSRSSSRTPGPLSAQPFTTSHHGKSSECCGLCFTHASQIS